MLDEALTISFISGLLKKAGESIYSSAVEAAKSALNKNELFKTLSNPQLNKTYSNNIIKKTFTFRTIIRGDRDVYLHEIYYPLEINSKDKKVRVEDGITIKDDKYVCLVGVAGQGKTITMRKLFLEELNKNTYFPFFISLRSINFSKEVMLDELLMNHLSENGIKCSLGDVNNFLESSNIRLFLDGFDEIPHEHRMNAIKLLEECNYFWDCSVICSTRPETEFTRLAGFSTYNISFLEEKDVVNIVRIHVKSDDTRSLLTELINDKAFLRESIVTPILVDIFIVTSIGLGKNPENVASYYDALFSSLIYKHDFNKIFTRTRKSKLNDVELESCLSYFSFVTYILQKTTFTQSEMMDVFIDAKNHINKEDENEIYIMDDIVNMTNLIVKDGYNLYTYIHKSIQDYYAARFICNSSDVNQTEFWNNIHKDILEQNFCYMYKCLSPHNYYNMHITNLINEASIIDNEGKAKYVTIDIMKNYLLSKEVVFDLRFERFYGVRGINENDGLIFEYIDNLYVLMFFREIPGSVLSPVFNFLADEFDNILNMKSELRISEDEPERVNSMFVYKIQYMMEDFPKFNDYLIEGLHVINAMIDEMITDYQKNMHNKHVREASTLSLIMGFKKH